MPLCWNLQTLMIVPVLVGKLLENNLITEEQANQIICAIFNDNYLGEYSEGDVLIHTCM